MRNLPFFLRKGDENTNDNDDYNYNTDTNENVNKKPKPLMPYVLCLLPFCL